LISAILSDSLFGRSPKAIRELKAVSNFIAVNVQECVVLFSMQIIFIEQRFEPKQYFAWNVKILMKLNMCRLNSCWLFFSFCGTKIG